MSDYDEQDQAYQDLLEETNHLSEKLDKRLRETEASLLNNMNSYINENYKPDDVHEEYDAGGYIGDPRGCMNEGEVTGFQKAMNVVRAFFMED